MGNTCHRLCGDDETQPTSDGPIPKTGGLTTGSGKLRDSDLQ